MVTPRFLARADVDRITAGFTDKTAFFVDKLAEGVGTLAAAFYPKDVIVRLSDFKTNEYARLAGGILAGLIPARHAVGIDDEEHVVPGRREIRIRRCRDGDLAGVLGVVIGEDGQRVLAQLELASADPVHLEQDALLVSVSRERVVGDRDQPRVERDDDCLAPVPDAASTRAILDEVGATHGAHQHMDVIAADPAWRADTAAAISAVGAICVTEELALSQADRDWVDAGTNRVAHYTRLAPGDYTLRLDQLGGEGRPVRNLGHRLVDAGADGIMTDDPAALAAFAEVQDGLTRLGIPYRVVQNGVVHSWLTG